MNTAPQAPKKGMSTTSIVLIVVGLLVVFGLGTCGLGAIWVGHKAKEFKEGIADGGLILSSPPEVVAALAGPKKDYVGAWTSESGKSTLTIQADGNFSLVQAEDGSTEKINMAIAAFEGNDFEARAGLTFKVAVSEPPHQAHSRWEMTARKIRFHRN